MVPVGIDTAGISFRVDKIMGEPEAAQVVYDANSKTEVWKYRRRLPGGGMINWGLGQKAWLEASLPKRLRGDNVEGLSTMSALDVLRDAYGEACEVVHPTQSFESADIARLDLVREFDEVQSFVELANGLSRIAPPGRATSSMFSDGAAAGAMTLSVGTKTTWRVRAYDKHHESKGLAPEGRVRFESQLRGRMLQSEWAKEQGGLIRYVGHLAEAEASETLAAIGRGMFERSGMDRKVCSSTEAAKVIGAAEGLTASDRYGLLGYLTGRAAGWPVNLHRHTVRKYERLARALGIVVQAADVETLSYSVRLDYDSGREVLEVG